jgi:hypothetical protein
MEVPMYLNVNVIGCGLLGGSLAAMLPIVYACGLAMGLV